MKIEQLTDQQCLDFFRELLATRIKLGTAYVADPETGVLTGQIILLTCGDITAQSLPEPLTYPLMPIINKDNNIMVN